jgi:hypothetical protein
MMLAAFQFHLLARDAEIDRLEGGFFLTALIAFVAYAVWIGRRNAAPVEQATFDEIATASLGRTGKGAIALNCAAVVVGVGLLAAGYPRS